MLAKSNYTHTTKILVTGLLCLFTIIPTCAQDIDYARGVVKKLASAAFKGRGYAMDGAKKASVYIADEFKKDGLSPLNAGSYFQQYQLSANIFPGVVSVKLDEKKLVTAADYLISASSPSIKGKFDVVTISRALLHTEAQLLELTARAERSFILLDNRPAQDETSTVAELINENVSRLKNDETLHFKGLMIFTTDKLTWTSYTYQSARPVITINKKDFDPQLVRTITVQIDAKLLPDFHPSNVVAMVKGTAVPDSMLVVTAHYDHLGMMGKKVYFPGANDNASGTAFLLSMAKYYGSHPGKYTMVFIAFSGEEIGMLGSQAFVDNPLIDLKKIKFLTNFDMAGTGEEGIRVVNGTVYKDRFNQLVQLNNEYKLLAKVDIRGESCNSDHCRFYQRGVPSFFIYTQGGIKAYHDIYDRAETLPLTAFENYFKLMLKFFDQIR